MKYKRACYVTVIIVLCATLGIGSLFVENYSNMNTRTADATRLGQTFGSGASIIDMSDNSITHYNTNNYNVEYHDSIATIAEQNDLNNGDSGIAWVKDSSGKKVALPVIKGVEYTTYYKPGYYKYGGDTYVPSYEDSIYLSKSYR